MAQNLNKTSEVGIYLAGDIPSKKSDRGSYKFVIRSTVTVNGTKKTIKNTVTKHGQTYTKALQSVVEDKPMYKDAARDKMLGVTSDDDSLQMITLDEVWKEYSDHRQFTAAKLWSKTNTRTTLSQYKNLIQPYIGSKRAIAVGYKDVADCIQKARARGLSPRSEQSVVSALKPMFSWWYKMNDLQDRSNPAREQEIRDIEPRVVHLNWDEINKLYTAMYAYPVEKYREVFIWLSTGRRINEVLTLKHTDIDGNYYTITAANNKVRKPMMYRLPDGITLPLHKGFIHTAPRDRNKQLIDPSVHKNWYALTATVNMPNLHKHDLRHIIETKLADSLVPLEIRNMVLGHLEAGASKHYNNDTIDTADLKHKAVTFFLDKVFNRIDKKMMWNEYI